MTTNDPMDSARACADVLTTRWFTPDTPGHWVPNDFWKTPTICLELVTYMDLAGTQQFASTCANAREASRSWLTQSGWLDDATCWGRFFVRAHRWLAALHDPDATQYLACAVEVYENLCEQWDAATCDGGLLWERDPSADGNFKAMNSTLGLMEIAAGLHLATGDAGQLAWAQKAWAWARGTGLIDQGGLVWGGLDMQSCTRLEDNEPVIALQGGAVGPLWLLYAATGDTGLLDTAQRIVAGSMEKFAWPGTRVFQTEIDGEWANGDPGWQVIRVNDTLFKGIFAGFLGEFARNLATVPGREQVAASYAAILDANAAALVANYPKGIFSMDWHTAQPDYAGNPDDTLNACLQFSALSAFDGAVNATRREVRHRAHRKA